MCGLVQQLLKIYQILSIKFNLIQQKRVAAEEILSSIKVAMEVAAVFMSLIQIHQQLLQSHPRQKSGSVQPAR